VSLKAELLFLIDMGATDFSEDTSINSVSFNTTYILVGEPLEGRECSGEKLICVYWYGKYCNNFILEV
jgi:hypothetical protein